jgi:hypothetical protein
MTTRFEQDTNYLQDLVSLLPASVASNFVSFGKAIKVWPQVRKATFEQWVMEARSRKTANQLELFAWKQPPLITLGADEYIWKDGQLYKAVRPWDQPQTPLVPWVRPQPVQPVMPGDSWVGDIPGWYTVTWCSDKTHVNANGDATPPIQMVYSVQ